MTKAKTPSFFEFLFLLAFVTMLQGWSLGASQFFVCNSPPQTTDDATSAWRNADFTVRLTCSTPPNCGCQATKYCVYDNGTPACVPSLTGTAVPVFCPSGGVCRKIVRYYSNDSFGSVESVKSSDVIRIDKLVPNVSALAFPGIISPNNDGVNDYTMLYYNLSDNLNPLYVRVLIHDAPPSIAESLVEGYRDSGSYSAGWDGEDKYGRRYEHKFVYTVTVTDLAGNSNSTSGFVVVDLSGPEFIEHSISSGIVELGEPAFISATLMDASGVDSVFACNTSANCYTNPLEQYCRMENATGYRDKFSCSFIPSPIGTYSYYLFANDSQNIFSNVSGSFRVRNVSVSVDVEPKIVDRQGSVVITANYTENSSYPIAGSCYISGDVSGDMGYSGGQYAATVSPSRLENNFFTVTCSKLGFPARSVSGTFLSRDLNVLLGFEFDPLAKDLDNILYAYVSTVNDYSRVETADIHSFSITGPNGFSRTGDFGRNSATKRWETVFKPPYTGTYAANADFRNSDNISGSADIQMAAEKGFKLSNDISGSLSVDLGSSGLANILVENRRKKDVLYNITLIGDLFPVSFDGQALSSHRYKTFAFVPAGSLQSHPLLIRGLEVSPFAKEVRIQFREDQPPFDYEYITLNYVVVSNLENRKFAPDLSFFSLLPLLFSGVLLLAQGKYFKI